jgi:hypothetical protein
MIPRPAPHFVAARNANFSTDRRVIRELIADAAARGLARKDALKVQVTLPCPLHAHQTKVWTKQQHIDRRIGPDPKAISKEG